MPRIELETTVDAPRERVFDLARSVEFHEHSMVDYDEEAVGGVTAGLLGDGDQVTWRARHFGVPMRMSAEVTAFDRPAGFRDEQVDGPFAELVHEHRFERVGGRTRMVDDFRFHSPLGPLGRVADELVLEAHLRELLDARGRALKRVAESGQWRRFF